MSSPENNPGRFSLTPPGPAVERADRPAPHRRAYQPPVEARIPGANEFSLDLKNNRAILKSRVTSIAKGEFVERRLTTLIPDRLGSSFNNDFIIQNHIQGVFIAADNARNPRLSKFAAEEFSARAKIVDRDSLDETTAIAKFHKVIGTVDNSLSILKANRDDPEITDGDADIKVEMAAAIRVGAEGNKFVFFNSGNSATHIVSPNGEIETVVGEHLNPDSLRNLRDYTLAVKEVAEGSSILVSSDEEMTKAILEDRHPRISAQSQLGFYNIPLPTERVMDYEQGDKDVSILIIDVGEQTAADRYGLPPLPVNDLSSHRNNQDDDRTAFHGETDSNEVAAARSRGDEILDALDHSTSDQPQGVAALLGAMGDQDRRLLDRNTPRRRRSIRNIAGGVLGAVNNTITTGFMATGNFLSKHPKGAIGALGAIGVGLVAAKYGFDVDIPLLPDAPDNLPDVASYVTDVTEIPGKVADAVDKTWDTTWNDLFGGDTTTTEVKTTPIKMPDHITTDPLETWDGMIEQGDTFENTGFFNGTAYDAVGEKINKFFEDNQILDQAAGFRAKPEFGSNYHQFIADALEKKGMDWESAQNAQPGTTFEIDTEKLRTFLVDQQGIKLETTTTETVTTGENGNFLRGLGVVSAASVAVLSVMSLAEAARRKLFRRR